MRALLMARRASMDGMRWIGIASRAGKDQQSNLQYAESSARGRGLVTGEMKHSMDGDLN